ncbi:MAG: PIN domain-containing protein [Deltaproteobacteria bacterium]|nr:MAG: PIN domain-containing protein [Deltaproteobacteria bacterium]
MKKDTFIKLITGNHSLYLDTNIFIYHLEDKDPYSQLTTPLFELLESGKIIGHTSVLSLMELNVGPYKQGRADLSFSHTALLQNLKGLKIHPVDLEIADLSAQYRARYSFTAPDSLHLATGVISKSKLFLGNDKSLRKFKELDLMILDEFI